MCIRDSVVGDPAVHDGVPKRGHGPQALDDGGQRFDNIILSLIHIWEPLRRTGTAASLSWEGLRQAGALLKGRAETADCVKAGGDAL